MAIRWRKDLEIGIDKVDNQHKALFEKVNNLLDACSERKGAQEIGSTLEFLSEYVKTHFRDEEQLQVQYGYPKFQEHLMLHNEFLRQVSSIKKTYEEEGANLTFIITINKKVIDWLINHIGKVDREFGQFVRSNTEN